MARRSRGFTLIEVMLAMALMLIGSLGMLSLHRAGVLINADARRITRATALAQDLVAQMQSWDYVHDTRLANTVTTNDAVAAYTDPHDSDGSLDERTLSPTLCDHSESELEASSLGWLGVSTADASAAGFTRYWDVTALPEDYTATGVLGGIRVAVFVVWEQGGARRHVTLTTFIRNPQVTN